MSPDWSRSRCFLLDSELSRRPNISGIISVSHQKKKFIFSIHLFNDFCKIAHTHTHRIYTYVPVDTRAYRGKSIPVTRRAANFRALLLGYFSIGTICPRRLAFFFPLSLSPSRVGGVLYSRRKMVYLPRRFARPRDGRFRKFLAFTRERVCMCMRRAGLYGFVFWNLSGGRGRRC